MHGCKVEKSPSISKHIYVYINVDQTSEWLTKFSTFLQTLGVIQNNCTFKKIILTEDSLL